MWIKCIGFDTDGVILNSDPIHYRAFNTVLKKNNFPRIGERRYYKKYLAYDDKNFFLEYLKEINKFEPTKEEIARLVDEKSEEFKQLLKKNPLKFYPGIKELIRAMSKEKILFDVTGSNKDDINAIFRKGGIDKCFDVIVTSEDVNKPKPSPEPYLKAFEYLKKKNQIKPYECIVTEDAPDGILSAKGAGFYTIGVTNTSKEEDLWSAGADLVFDKLDINIYDRLIQIEKRPTSKLELLDLFSDFLPN